MKANIEQAKKDMADAKTRQSEASKDIKRIEKDISDFSNNKDDKLAELQSRLSALQKSESKNSTSVKTLQKELQAARLEAEQSDTDLGAAREQLEEVHSTLKGQEDEIQALQKEQAEIKVSNESGAELPADFPRMLITWHKHVSTMSEQSSQASTRSFDRWKKRQDPRHHVSPKKALRSKSSPIRLRNSTKSNRPARNR